MSVVQEMHLKIFSNFGSGSHFIQHIRTILALLVEGIIGKNFQLGPAVQEMVFKDHLDLLSSSFISGGNFVPGAQQSVRFR